MSPALRRQALAEFVGTALLLLAVVGSGIMAAELSPNDVGLQLLENAIATGVALVAIILAVGPVSGAHLNPAVTLADLAFGGLSRKAAGVYIGAQVTGGAFGVVLANVMFDLPAVSVATKARFGAGLWIGEVVATIGLLLVIFGMVRARRTETIAFAVGAYITGAYFFTSSTSFANPAVTVTRTLSDTFAGIAPGSVLPFVGAQLLGTGVAIALVRALYPDVHDVAGDVVVPHDAATSEEVPA